MLHTCYCLVVGLFFLKKTFSPSKNVPSEVSLGRSLLDCNYYSFINIDVVGSFISFKSKLGSGVLFMFSPFNELPETVL